jgi:hypothetical protein
LLIHQKNWVKPFVFSFNRLMVFFFLSYLWHNIEIGIQFSLSNCWNWCNTLLFRLLVINLFYSRWNLNRHFRSDLENSNDAILSWGDVKGDVHAVLFNSALIALFERPPQQANDTCNLSFHSFNWIFLCFSLYTSENRRYSQ